MLNQEIFSQLKIASGMVTIFAFSINEKYKKFSFNEKYKNCKYNIFFFLIIPMSEFNEFKLRLKSTKNRFQLSAGLNLKKLNTI